MGASAGGLFFPHVNMNSINIVEVVVGMISDKRRGMGCFCGDVVQLVCHGEGVAASTGCCDVCGRFCRAKGA